MGHMVTKAPIVSVVIPVYQTGSILLDAVDSALAQVGVEVEVIVCNDGSDDDPTVHALKEAEQRGAHVINALHAGVSATRNAACQAARGRYILPLDADDRIEPTFAQQASEVLDARPEVGIVSSVGRYFGESDATFGTGPFDMGRMLHENIIAATAAFRRDDWEVVGGYCEDLPVLEDYALWLRLIRLGREVEILPEQLFWYRQWPGQVTRNPSNWHGPQALIFAENHELFARFAAEYVDFQYKRSELLKHYRNRYGPFDHLLHEARKFVNRQREKLRGS